MASDSPLERPADARIDQDVGAPQAAGQQGERDAEPVEVVHAALGQGEDPRRGERHPEQIERAARAGDGDHQRADELEGHRDPQRNAVDRRVEREVHAGQHEPEQSGEQQIRPGAPAPLGSPQWDEDDRAAEQPQPYRAARADAREQRDRDRRAELDRGDRAEHERGRRRRREQAHPPRRGRCLTRSHGGRC
jgi:hypothetical protein